MWSSNMNFPTLLALSYSIRSSSYGHSRCSRRQCQASKCDTVIVMVAMARSAIIGGDGATSTSHFVENSCGP